MLVAQEAAQVHGGPALQEEALGLRGRLRSWGGYVARRPHSERLGALEPEQDVLLRRPEPLRAASSGPASPAPPPTSPTPPRP
eukprot:5755287-Alexandrium_andersonii.AAC.1